MHIIITYIIGGIIYTIPPFITTSLAAGFATAAIFSFAISVKLLDDTSQILLTGNLVNKAGTITGFGNLNRVMHHAKSATESAASDLASAHTLLKFYHTNVRWVCAV